MSLLRDVCEIFNAKEIKSNKTIKLLDKETGKVLYLYKDKIYTWDEINIHFKTNDG